MGADQRNSSPRGAFLRGVFLTALVLTGFYVLLMVSYATGYGFLGNVLGDFDEFLVRSATGLFSLVVAAPAGFVGGLRVRSVGRGFLVGVAGACLLFVAKLLMIGAAVGWDFTLTTEYYREAPYYIEEEYEGTIPVFGYGSQYYLLPMMLMGLIFVEIPFTGIGGAAGGYRSKRLTLERAKRPPPKPKPVPKPIGVEARVYDYIVAHGGRITKEACMRELRITEEQFIEAIQSLQKAGKLRLKRGELTT